MITKIGVGKFRVMTRSTSGLFPVSVEGTLEVWLGGVLVIHEGDSASQITKVFSPSHWTTVEPEE